MSTSESRKRIGCLNYLIHPVTDSNIEHIQNCLSEIVSNGGFQRMLRKLKTKTFKKQYSEEDIKIITNNMSLLKDVNGDEHRNEKNRKINDESIPDCEPRAALLNDDISLMDIPVEPIEKSQTTADWVNKTSYSQYENDDGSEQGYKIDSQKLYTYFKSTIMKKASRMEKETPSDIGNAYMVKELLTKIMILHSKCLVHEKDRLEIIEKIKDIHLKQKDICKEIIKQANVIKTSVSEIKNFDENINRNYNEFLDNARKEREDIWKTFLKTQMESLKSVIINNLPLN